MILGRISNAEEDLQIKSSTNSVGQCCSCSVKGAESSSCLIDLQWRLLSQFVIQRNPRQFNWQTLQTVEGFCK